MALDGGYIGSWHHAQAERYSGMADGFVAGKSQGYDEGQSDGYEAGHREGRAQGYREGYKIGWQECMTSVQPRIDRLNGEIGKANATIRRMDDDIGKSNVVFRRMDDDIGKANVIIRDKNTKIAALEKANAALTAELAALKAQHQSMLQAQQQAAAMQAALRKANEQLQQQLQQTADERDAKHALAVERAYRYNRLSVVMGAARDTLREATEAKCEPARRIANLFSINFAKTEAEALVKRMILLPLVKDPAFDSEAPKTMQFINDMQFIQRADPPNRMPFDNEQLYED